MQAQLTEAQRKLKSYNNSVQLREQSNCYKSTTPRSTLQPFLSINTYNSDSGKKTRGSRHFLKDFQCDIAQITNFLSPTENSAPPGIRDLFASLKDKNSNIKILFWLNYNYGM